MPSLAAIIPGFGRHTDSVRLFALDLAKRGADVLVKDLPGHAGYEPMLPVVTMDTLVDHFRRRLQLDRPSVLIGESLGGLIGLALAARPPTGIAAVIAIDPPLTMQKQRALRADFERGDDRFGWWAAYAEPIFGLSRAKGAVVSVERDYRGLLTDQPAVPVHVIVGGREDGLSPTTLDAEDRELIAAAPGFTLHHAGPSVGHVVLDEARELVAALVVKIMRTPALEH
jgi:pimeloyl-ACP methyl ester carboxylesterase